MFSQQYEKVSCSAINHLKERSDAYCYSLVSSLFPLKLVSMTLESITSVLPLSFFFPLNYYHFLAEANSVVTDQTFPRGLVCSGSAL